MFKNKSQLGSDKYLFLKIIYLFLEGGEGRKRGRETSMCCYLLCVPLWGPGLQPRHVPWLGSEPAMLWFAGWCSIHWATPARASQTDILSEIGLMHRGWDVPSKFVTQRQWIVAMSPTGTRALVARSDIKETIKNTIFMEIWIVTF